MAVTASVLARLGGLEPPASGLEARQLSPCSPPVAGPRVRLRVRIASRGQRRRQRLSLPPRGHVPDRKPGEAGLSAEIVSLRGAVLDVVSSPCPRRATTANSPIRHRVDSARHHAPHCRSPWITLGKSRTAQPLRREKPDSPNEFGAYGDNSSPESPRDRRWLKSRAGPAECHTAPSTYWIDLIRR